MIKLLKYQKKSWLLICIIFILMIAQAYCDLKLPAYTSDIIDVGIQQSGIDSALPTQISSISYNKLRLFMTDDENSALMEHYTADGDRYKLGDIDDETKATLESIIKNPMMVVYMLENISPEQMSSFSEEEQAKFAQIPEGMSIVDAMSRMPAENRMEMREKMISGLDQYGGLIGDSMTINYVINEYTALEINLDDIQMSYLKDAGLRMILLAFIIMAISAVVGYLAAEVGSKFGLDVRSRLFKKVLTFSNAEMDKFSTASLITRTTNDIQQVQMILIMILRMIMYAPILGIGGVLKVISTKTDLSWIIFVAVAAIFVIVMILMIVAMPKFKKMQSLVDRLNLVTREILTGLPVIRAFGREKNEEERFNTANTNLMKTQLFTNRTMTFMMPLMMFIMNAIAIMIMWYGGKSIDAGIMQVGDLTAFITYTMLIVMSFLMLSMVSVMLPRAIVAAGRINEVLGTDVSIVDKKDAKSSGIITKGDVSFENVSFRYGDAKENVLDNISFTAKSGQTTAIIGSTGSGKSTLINLIPRFFDVTDGKITIDGTDLREMSQKYLRENIGIVPQKGILFSGTIASNLRFGKEDASDEEIAAAAEIAQATEFISEKPDKYGSNIAQGGSNVSGGQKQRLAIARAIAKKPKIYIFDDSFSALDYKTDVTLRRALSSSCKESSVIIVAQRISTVLHAEQIIVLDDGKIAGIGNHEYLLDNCDVYSQIASSQLSEEELIKTRKGAK